MTSNPEKRTLTCLDSVVDFTLRERFRRYLETIGKRLTEERAVIVDMIVAHPKPFTADELVKQVSAETGRRVSRSTVFRTLIHMQKAGLLQERLGTDGVAFFDFSP